MSLISRVVRVCRALVERWSPERDRAFHDAVFSTQAHDPFTFAFPGYITIRRFADLASARLDGLSSALDLGCGTAEITCELARRHPQVSFLGVDHSEVAIARAGDHAARLGLANVTFQVADMSGFEPPRQVDIVLMFDSFHHCQDPADLVRRLGRATSRFLLVEPHGDWKGSWRRDVDCDWLLFEMEKIRSRLAHVLGEPPVAGAEAAPGNQAQAGEPTENRYSLEEFERFFAGYGLEVRGTVAGIDAYPPSPHQRSRTREWFGRFGYEMLTHVDEALREQDLDPLAKHWVIYCERGTRGTPRRVPRTPDHLRSNPDAPPGEAGDPALLVRGPYDIEYVAYDGPRILAAEDDAMASVRVRNRSWRTWTSQADPPIFASYHWLDADGALLVVDGARSPLPRPVAPGDECDVALRLRAPPRPGRYLLALDLVHEGITWFSEAGSPSLQIPVRVRTRR